MMMFVLGMLAWQVVTTVVYIISGKDEEATLWCAYGVCALAAAGVVAIVNKIRLHKSRKYNLYHFFGREGEDGRPVWIASFYMTEQDAERFNLIDRNADPIPYCVRLYRTGYEFECIPPQNEILTAEMIENGVPGLSKDFFKKFFKTT